MHTLPMEPGGPGKPDRRVIGLSLLIAAVSGLLIWFSSPWGVGTSPDSTEYMLSAMALSRGDSVLDLPRHWPPLYPVALALANLAVDDIPQAARLFHPALIVLNTALFSFLVSDCWRDRRILPAVATVVFGLAPANYAVHYMAWSEPLFFTWLLLHLLALQDFLRRGNNASLCIAGLCVGLAS